MQTFGGLLTPFLFFAGDLLEGEDALSLVLPLAMRLTLPFTLAIFLVLFVGAAAGSVVVRWKFM